MFVLISKYFGKEIFRAFIVLKLDYDKFMCLCCDIHAEHIDHI